ncbi:MULTISPECIES: MntP/YtaF family protein [Clostridium]|uniref:Sporulation protein YtaF n=2 Tax=Clostridium butyricum TaxID=1492 RepID=C4IG99_CLOBU|nr:MULTISPECIES: hypothetical protein [Clostridium]APF23712.1 hypothetical protein NPD4_1936 [Clostridium butyricum]EDT73859.1 conserved hypothetical protein [Clostridium butyricum 5521]EEP53866.1 conserved hypothetical protein [Clostridium butyricum E4 str. BoNT E BL5262]EMU54709.1 hypothetical protein CBDKU1_15230 [Clostridium butyricum DKU-01]MBS4839709.1 hypothetical protein [Clostridium sp.]
MNFLSALLLSTAINIDTLKISFSSKNDSSVPLNLKILFASIFTTFITFLAFCFGKIIDIYFTHSLSNIFGSVLLGFVGVYYLIEHIRIQKDNDGYDTSFYVNNFKKHKNLIELNNPYIYSDSFKNLFNISIALSLNNILPSIAGSLTNINLPLTILFNFLICIFFYIAGNFIYNKKFIKYIKTNHYLITSILLIILSVFESFH